LGEGGVGGAENSRNKLSTGALLPKIQRGNAEGEGENQGFDLTPGTFDDESCSRKEGRRKSEQVGHLSFFKKGGGGIRQRMSFCSIMLDGSDGDAKGKTRRYKQSAEGR